MTESQRQRVPTDDDGELSTSLAFLDFVRASAIKKLDGLSEEQARRELVPTGTTLLGLVRHLIDGEVFWFGVHLAGEGDEPDWDAGMSAGPQDTIDSVVARYRQAIADSDRNIARAGSPDALSVGTVAGRRTTLRWTLAHMTGETARHAGHADILRELVDGVTGR